MLSWPVCIATCVGAVLSFLTYQKFKETSVPRAVALSFDVFSWRNEPPRDTAFLKSPVLG